MTRYALIDSKSAAGWSGNGVATVEKYLPSNYRVLGENEHGILVAGEDDHGWTLDDYVLPRLSSGLIAGQEISEDHPAVTEIAEITEIANNPRAALEGWLAGYEANADEENAAKIRAALDLQDSWRAVQA